MGAAGAALRDQIRDSAHAGSQGIGTRKYALNCSGQSFDLSICCRSCRGRSISLCGHSFEVCTSLADGIVCGP
jgi:hypothetical protein